MSDRLERLLGTRETVWLVERVRRRLEQGRPPTGTVTLGAASPEQRRAIELLLGRRAGTGTSLSVSLDEVDRVLRSSGACPDGLAAAVVLLRGPVRDLPRENTERETAWRGALSELDAVVADRPELHGWRSWLDATGQVRRSAPGPDEARVLLDRLAEVLRRLPHPGIPIGRLAAESCGDAHALDEGRPLATLAMSAARSLAGLPYAGEGTADARRRAWAGVGVHLDDLSSTVVCLGLPGDDRTPTGRMLAAAREAGEPCVLTLRQLRRHETPIAAGLVRICENPVVVAAAADELGPLCPGLVCVSGRPSAAVWRLLDLLAAGETAFAYHGDFDWGGVGIAAAVHERVGWRPWRYDTASYQAVSSRNPLTGSPRPTPWDPGLSAAMTRRAVRVEEELVLSDLLADLAAAASSSSATLRRGR
ncbi:TIGR02679 family protein [Streptosporangium sp. NBC_01755]|uniref:TIGR02679 family protein n=1 Tax=Streptosporangium sp. NBC_01755 TaxID=2975949 RepID=UPI002DDC2E3B|nr:TIGR02679 family protein [Streptosporangium sp. NBC_01755]WSC98575.1 TIGR02679 family protein [Streptosporangium sp. NBC_01755]